MDNTDIVAQTHQAVNDILDGKVKLNPDGTLTAVKPTYGDDMLWAKGTEEIGATKIMRDSRGADIIYRKQVNGRWAAKGSTADEYQDLTPSEKGDILRNMTTSVDTNMIPNADVYLDNGFNVLLVGLHGTGKTASIQALARDRGFKMKYYSCSTLDPFTDLVGVPTPRDYCTECKLYFKDQAICDNEVDGKPCGNRTVESLKMVRPREVDEAEIIFLDEFNRADSKTQNALFEMIQFGTINGEPLPNLKACWAAINPPDDEQNYDVEKIDPALMDRFDVYIEVTAKPSVVYMTQHMPEPIARTLKLWWDDHQNAIRAGSKDAHSDYISPRRLEKIGLVWCATKNARSVYAALPMGGNFERTKLMAQLKAAQEEVNRDLGVVEVDANPDIPNVSGTGLGDRPNPDFTYHKANMILQKKELAAYLTKEPLHYETHNAVVAELKTGTGGEDLILKYGEILNALNPSSLEGFVAGQPPAKQKVMRNTFAKLYNDDDPTLAKSLTHLHKVLNGLKLDTKDWPTSL